MKNYVKIFLVLVLLVAGLSGVKGQSNEFTVPLSDPAKRGKLKAHLNSGSIIVKGTARKDVLIRYTVIDEERDRGRDRDEDDDDMEENSHEHANDKTKDKPSKAGLKKIGGGGIDLQVTENDNFVKAESGSWTNPIKLEIEVPSGFDLQVHTYNDGDLMISNIQGALELTNFNGEITALNIAGSTVATTYNGEIRVTFDKVTDNTPMSFTTYNGDIDVTFPSAFKSSLKLKTEQGSIYSDFDVQLKSTAPVQKSDSKGGVYKVVVDEWKRGDLNGGGAEVTMRNYNGDIILRKK